MGHYYSAIRQHSAEIVGAICSKASFKTASTLLVAGLDFFLGGNKQTVFAIFVLVSLDFITALMAKFKIKEPIESKKALKTVTKIVVYGLFISAATITEKTVPGTTFMDEVAISFLAITELISIMENIAKMGYTMPQKLLNQLYTLKK